MASANDLIVLFLGLEMLSIALYVLAASHLRRIQSQESGIKYFVLGGFSSAFFLYGIALIYGATGSTNMAPDLQLPRHAPCCSDKGLLFAGIALLLVGLRLQGGRRAVPHVDARRVPGRAHADHRLHGVGVQGGRLRRAAAGLLDRVHRLPRRLAAGDLRPGGAVACVVGSVLAIVQTDVKRMLAYSSISHAGFILVGVEAMATSRARRCALRLLGALFYLLAYTVIVLGSFGVVMLVARSGDGDTSLDAYRGLSHRRPLLAFTFTVLLLAQAGVPLTAGFVAKFDVILAAVDARSYVLAIIAMLTAVIAAFLYLRIIVTMYMGDDATETAPLIRVPPSAAVGLGLTLAFTVVVGFLPGLVVDFARDAAATHRAVTRRRPLRPPLAPLGQSLASVDPPPALRRHCGADCDGSRLTKTPSACTAP